MKKTLFALIAGATLMLAGAAQAGVVGFENVSTAGDFTSLSDLNPYAGLNWSADWYAGDNTIDGYGNAAHSGTNFALNGFGDDPVGIASTTAFNFAGAWFATPAGAADQASWIDISAYDAGNNLIGTTGHVAVSNNYVWVAAAFNNVSSISITRDTGWYVMDDFTTVDNAPSGNVPEPATPLVLGIGAFAMVLGRVRARRRSM